MKKYFVMVLVCLVFFNVTNKVAAATLISKNDIANVIKNDPYYNSSRDEIRVDLYSSLVRQIDYEFYHDANFTIEGTKRTIRPPEGYWYNGFGMNCEGWYIVTGKSASGETLFNMRVEVSQGDLQSPKCLSDGDDQHNITDSDSGSESSGSENGGVPVAPERNECAELICECLANVEQSVDHVGSTLEETNTQLSNVNSNLNDLKQIGNVINNSITSTNEKLDAANSNLNKIDDSINDLHDEFKTDKDYKMNDLPDISNVLDDNKPDLGQTKFEDKNVYFTDQGDAEVIDKLPKAPEPKDWDGVTRDNDLLKESEFELNKFNQDDEMNLFEFNQDDEMNLSEFNQDDEMNLSEFNQDDEMNTNEFNRTEEYDQSNDMNRNHFYDQTNNFP